MTETRKTDRIFHAGVLAAVLYLVAGVSSSVLADSWSVTGPMLEARTGHVMAYTRYHVGRRVLVAGGYNATAVLSSAELFDPFTGTFESVGPMSTARWSASATPDQSFDSDILITGGVDAAGNHLSSAEIYYSSLKSFYSTGSMSTPRRGHTSTTLHDRRVLVAGGYNGSYVSSAELWSPNAGGNFSNTGSMASARRAHTATLLPNGKVLITGGEDSPNHYLSSAELYDPATGTFSGTAGPMNAARSLHSASLLKNGKVLIAGGYNGTYLDQAELYDPGTGTFTPTGSMTTGRRNHEAIVLDNGKVLINGGFNNGTYPDTVELYDPATGTFSGTVPLHSPRTFHASVALLDGKVLVTGGENSTGYLSSAELYTPDPPGNIVAGPFEFSEHPVSQTSSFDSMPRLGNDGVSDLVTFTRREILPNGLTGRGDIYYQRLDRAGNTAGAAVKVTNGNQDFYLNDVSGDYIVYTAYDSIGSHSGRIMVYQISTTLLYGIGSALVIGEPRIHGNKVAWREGGGGGTLVMLYDLSWLGTARDADVIAGPIPPAFNVDIGDRFVVWSEFSDAQYDLVAYDLAAGVRVAVTATPTTLEREPSTSGAWVVWGEYEKGVGAFRIIARNLDTGERRVVVDSGVYNYRPSISGDFITYESMLNGNMDVYLYRISTGETRQVTSNLAQQYDSNVFGRLVAYGDDRVGINIYVTLLNLRPISNAGTGQTVPRGTLVNLDGSGSSDPDADYPLSYAWDFSRKPAGSNAVLQDPQAPNPSFTTDLPGDYRIRLIVTDSLGAKSDPAEVLVSTTNTMPVANAGPDQAVTLLGTVVALDGSQSFDPDGDSITYLWAFVDRPAGSQAILVNPASANPSFIADVHGDYTVSLVVTDLFGAKSPADTVVVSFSNVKPVANAGGNRGVDVGSTVTLDGSASYDANGDPLTYAWSIVSKPAGSVAELINPASVQAGFFADLVGTYVISLVVNDGFVNSDPSNVTITATSNPALVVQVLQEVIIAINGLTVSDIKSQQQNALTNKISAVLQDIQNGLYADALSKLQTDILKKTDGCAISGAPDRTDWINNCPAQSQVYRLIQEAIYLLKSM